MRQRNILLIAFLILIAGMAAAFLFLDFRAAQSNTEAQFQVSTSSSGEPVLENPPLQLYVEGPSGLTEAFVSELESRMGQFFENITLTEPSSPGTDRPVLVIDINTVRNLWTPVYATSVLAAKVAFASDGRVSWTDLGEVDTVFQTSGAVRISGEFTVSDVTRGIISRKAYQRYLGEQTAIRVSEALYSALQDMLR